MSLRRPRFDEENAVEAINISPLIDVIFILLIFFIVTMSFADGAAMKLEVPKAASAVRSEASAVTLVLDEDSSVFLDGVRYGVSSLQAPLKEKLANTGKIVIRCDSRANVKGLVEIMDCAKLCGAREIYVGADKKK